MPIRKLLVRAIDTFRDTRKIDAAILWADLSAESALALATTANGHFDPQTQIEQPWADGLKIDVATLNLKCEDELAHAPW